MSFSSRILAGLAKLPAAQTHNVSVERDLVAKMPDGAELLADRWYPVNPGGRELPTVLLRSPYGRRQLASFGRLFSERGYQVVIQSVRGTFGSAGVFEPFHNEKADGSATLDWVQAQPWFNGELLTFGPSYLGLTQWAVAETAPETVKGMSLNVTASNVRDSIIYPGGSFALESLLAWINSTNAQELGWAALIKTTLKAAKVVGASALTLPLEGSDQTAIGSRHDFFQNCVGHETPDDAWWDGLNYGKDLSAIPPTTLVGGWYDLFLHSQVADYEALVAAGRSSRLTIGPWHHGSPGGTGEAMRDALEWFDQQVKGGPARRQPVRLFVMGSDHWAEYPQWPPAADAQQWYLGQGGTLSTQLPGEGPADRYRYDPADPTPGVGGPALLAKNAGPKNQAKRESRSDVLTYTSPVLPRDLTVVGPLTATLHLRSSLEHTDFHVRLCDVSAKGKSTNLSDGIVRLTPGQVTKDADGVFTLDISMWPTANTFKAGHRVRLQVSSGAHPLFARNLGLGERLGLGKAMQAADQEVWHDPAHPSSLLLPVVQ